MAETSDVVIIGAGIMGCSVAFHLAQSGMKVTVLEKNTIGAGSTGRSSAIIRTHYSNEITARMALHSLRVFQDFEATVGGECEFRCTGWVALASAADRAGLEANVQLQQRVGIDTRLISKEELRDLVPAIDCSDMVAAAYEPESGYADPHLTVSAYADAARRHGADIRVNTEVTGIRFHGGRVVGVDTPDGTYAAPLVVNCAGPWGARVAAMAGVEIPINSCRIQVAVFHRPVEYREPHPVIMDFILGSYCRSEIGELTLVGSIDPSEADAVVDPDDYPEHMDDEFLSEVGELFVRRCPPMEFSETRGGYSGLYAVTPDWHPIVDEIPAGSGCFVCSGFSGHGFKLAPAVGVMISDMLGDDADPLFDPTAFRLDRFATDDLVRGTYAYSITG
ncbi:MAG: NAD(P)/FAD-dependent oxidoreductase [Gemmatimonadales bacterium]